ncbi:MAG TPA: VCBS repeat-containing protein [Candidatus Saccharimonadales bacterium]|jgi:hypothetical protein|nr:VCBS repeat-containing protein [Candidatus Saccharimonadales bacterium]
MNPIRAGFTIAVPLFTVLSLMIAPAAAFAQSAAGCSPSAAGLHFADVNGDGKVDSIAVNTNAVTVRRSDGHQFQRNEDWIHEGYFGTDPAGHRNIYFADVTGNGRADAIVANTNGITVRRSDGRKFLHNELWIREGYFGSDPAGHLGVYFADVTGDGKADAIVVNTNGITVRRSDGKRFLRNETWTNDLYYGERGTYFADVDGDGKADAIAVHRNGITVRRSDGRKFLPSEDWTSEGYNNDRDNWDRDNRDRDNWDRDNRDRDNRDRDNRDRDSRDRDYRDRDNRDQGGHYYFADVDGDGKADAIYVGRGGITVRLSDGTRFGPPTRWTRRAFIGDLGTFFVDVDGDGKADAIAVNTNGVTIRRSDGSSFTADEPWVTIPYYGEIGPTCGAGR